MSCTDYYCPECAMTISPFGEMTCHGICPICGHRLIVEFDERGDHDPPFWEDEEEEEE